MSSSTKLARDLTGVIPISGLTPSTLYFYRISVNGIPLPEVHQFRTFPRTSELQAFTFAVLSDFHATEEAPVYATVVQEGPAFVIFLGDFDH